MTERCVSRALIDTEDALAKSEVQRDIAFDAMENLIRDVNENLARYEANIESRESVLPTAISGLQRISETNEQRDETLVALASAQCEYRVILSKMGRNDESLTQYLAAVEVAERSDSESARRQQSLVANLLTLHYVRLARTDDATNQGKIAVELARQLVADLPDSERARLFLAAAALANSASSSQMIEQPDGSRKQLRKRNPIVPARICVWGSPQQRFHRSSLPSDSCRNRWLLAASQLTRPTEAFNWVAMSIACNDTR